MARLGGTSSQRPAAPNPGGFPPPSTIAAQIVNHASTVQGHEEPGLKIPFPELLREFLRNPIIDDLDPELNVQFISTIVEAGLDALHQDNPFALDRDKELAVDSIRAIDISIWQVPELLLNSRIRKGKDDIPNPPLFLWLFPKLLSILDPLKFETLQGSVQHLLTSFLQVFGSKSALLCQEASATHLYRSCVDSKCCSTTPQRSLSIISYLVCTGYLRGFHTFVACAVPSSVAPVEQH
jgi:serine/threonine-protein kinase ATR